MKVVLVTQGISRVVRPLLAECDIEVIGIIESAPRNYTATKRNKFKTKVKNILFYFGILKTQSLSNFCKINHIPYFFFKKDNKAELKIWLGKYKPDLMVVFSMSQLLTKDIYDYPKYGTINLHPSYLPSYRGPNPDFWQYYDMELNPGATVHYIDQGEDTGDIICQDRIHVPLGIKSSERLDKLIGDLGVNLLLKAIKQIKNNTQTRTIQPVESTTARARNITLNEHSTIIDWQNWPIERIWNILRGTEMWLNALEQPKGIYNGQRWCVMGYVKCSNENLKMVGKIDKDESGYFVWCMDGKIYLTVKFNIKNYIKRFLT